MPVGDESVADLVKKTQKKKLRLGPELFRYCWSGEVGDLG